MSLPPWTTSPGPSQARARSAIVHANGVTFDTRYEPMLDRSGHVIGVVGVHHDITALKRAEDLLIKANIELEEANQTLESRVRQRTQGMEDANSKLMAAQDQLVRAEKLAAIGQMAGGVAHDLRNPLGAIKNAAHFLKRRLASGELDESNPRIWQLLHIVEEEADNSNQIISDLLTFARVTTPSLSPVNVNGVIDDTMSSFEIDEGVDVVRASDHDAHVVLADRDQLQRVFMNLARNAEESMPDGGRLTISVNRVNEFVEVSFADTGVGIPQEHLGKVFDPLFTTKPKGTGLGLAICQEIVSSHKGTMYLMSVQGGGSTFTVRLPLNVDHFEEESE